MHTIEIGNITKQYPETIAEMTSEQFVSFAGLVFQYQSEEINYQEFKIKLLYSLLKMKRRVNLDRHADADKILYNIHLLSNLNEAFFESRKEKGRTYKVIQLDFVKNLVPKIKVGTNWYYGPGDALTNTEFGEYVTALNAYVDFSQSGNSTDLDILVGALYRPERTDNKMYRLTDKRTEFHKNAVPYYAKEVFKIPFETKYAVYLYFSACQHFIVTNRELPISGGVTVDLSVLFNNSTEGNEKGIGMAGVVYSLAESNVFGDAEKTAKQNTYDVLLRMLQTYLQAKKLERDAKNR